MNPNHAILLTPSGAAAIAVVRLRGPKAREFLAAHFSSGAPAPMRCRHGNLTDGEQVIDDPVVVVSEDGRIADLNLHGGTWVIAATLKLAEREGFEVVKPTAPSPEVALDAASTIEGEVLSHIPLATTELALAVLLNQPVAWERLLEGEAPAEPNGETNGSARQEPRPPVDVVSVLADRCLWWLLHPPRLAIVGAPNVGKSTLANRLFARERSITADLPGTTRDWVGEMANLDGLAVMLVDTPGLRETNDAIEREAIHRSRGQIEKADLILQVIDVTQPDEPIIMKGENVIRVLNKCDLPNARSESKSDDLRVCGKSGAGINTLIERIKQFFGCASIDVAQPRWWTERQRDLLERLRSSL
ncbi:MAG TPA: GTPase [Tepidisphaeraceae bacterium]|jgi:tRNA modification GTPase|nr:GTPase [Tepidisphaeraceae bacterium]